MEKTVLREYDLNPDGVRIIVDWDTMSIGTSIFIPCVNTQEAKKQLNAFFQQQSWEHIMKIRIESGKLGVRIWRIL